MRPRQAGSSCTCGMTVDARMMMRRTPTHTHTHTYTHTHIHAYIHIHTYTQTPVREATCSKTNRRFSSLLSLRVVVHERRALETRTTKRTRPPECFGGDDLALVEQLARYGRVLVFVCRKILPDRSHCGGRADFKLGAVK